MGVLLADPPSSTELEDSEDVADQGCMVIRTGGVLTMDDEQFFNFCQLNEEWTIERTAEGDIEVMHPEGLASGAGNMELSYQLFAWARRDGTGRVLGPATGFTLPNRAVRGPDASWVRNERLRALGEADRAGFAHLCPDFVAELRSRTDSMAKLRAKMEEYIANGARLAWLLDPLKRQISIYRPGEPVAVLRDPGLVAGDPVLPGFLLDASAVWQAVALED